MLLTRKRAFYYFLVQVSKVPKIAFRLFTLCQALKIEFGHKSNIGIINLNRIHKHGKQSRMQCFSCSS